MKHYRYAMTSIQAPRTQGLNRIFGERVRMLRREQHLTQGELARIIGASRMLVSHIEQGKADARLSCVEQVAAALCVDPHALLGTGSDGVETR